MMQKKYIAYALVCFLSGVFSSVVAYAQSENEGVAASEFLESADMPVVDTQVSDNAEGVAEGGMISAVVSPVQPITAESIPSLFFTYWQHQTILEAKSAMGSVVRSPTASELDALNNGQNYRPEPGVRDITLGGIVYKNKDDWMIWMNGVRITPTNVPKEILGLRVYKDFIEVKWFDEYTNQIFPLRLRAQQRFNIDARIFLPG